MGTGLGREEGAWVLRDGAGEGKMEGSEAEARRWGRGGARREARW